MRVLTLSVCLLASGCVPFDVMLEKAREAGEVSDTDPATETEDPAATDDREQGTLSGGSLMVDWTITETWDGGGCTEVTVSSAGDTLDNWAASIQLDQPITEVSWSGEHLEISGDRVVIRPSTPQPLATTSSLTTTYCISPDARPQLVEAIIDDPAPPVDDTGSPVTPDDTDQVIYGTIVDQDAVLGLTYEADGMENGGHCLAINIVNLTSFTLDNWSVHAQMSGNVQLTAVSGLNFFTDAPDELLTLPDANSRVVEGYSDQRGRVCMNPLRLPTAIVSSYQVEE